MLNISLVSAITRDTLFYFLIFVLSVYLLFQGMTKQMLKCLSVCLVAILLRKISNGNGFTVFIPDMFLFIITRTMATLMSTMPIVGMPPGEIVAVFKKMRAPQFISLPFIFMMRFFPTIRGEFREVFISMRLRNLISLKNPIKTLEYTFVPVMVRSTRIAEELAAASETRGISNPKGHTSRRKIEFLIKDYFLIGVSFFVTVALLILEKRC
ncbi:energy-coupling factor transporter transmembrane component T [Tepidibacter hydrothermalis]|uniref:Energy-coupling factor transporter transmembrane component T n=2 Tax=Tepidibacter hydrothermalis TaxID=3036126 RepID=A0ABY8EHB3_9FIRM|nr:energy-coupling factor transporter transmembrane component T [Tepidibacter hydrothermalis]WFD12347.1 energy-coupling factor transporter transmembrane component T [Tepidibacter hydrothermalis]